MGKYTKQLASFALALILVIVMVTVLIPGAVSKPARVTASASQGTWPGTIDDLVGRVSFVLVGTKLREEPVQTFYPNASYYLDVYHIDHMLKASFPWAGEEFTILYNRNSNTASDRQQPVTPVNGMHALCDAACLPRRPCFRHSQVVRAIPGSSDAVSRSSPQRCRPA